ncbi:probable Histone-lysine N-methyltransferase ATXR5 [Juglans microcarpa x Juglans regia]|uniref:probable Histone-lysine N-methyltransferase ATXR5 n=1 Tax=Juglans microcarpa x Juglans regia TaxID=2249226 RepID=UPI001B7E5176|nr:probable Histone-lysine N-methyltransferase ATXR5 [Juglans microcarpa x Juglans regia]
MAPATSSSSAKRLIRFSGSLRRTEAPRLPSSPLSPTPKKLKSMEEVMARARYAVVDQADYGSVGCEQCGSGDRPDELLLCDKCDKGFHMKCVRPIVVRVPIGSWLCPKCSDRRRVRSFSQKKIIDFFRIQKCCDKKDKFSSPLDARKRRRRSGSLVLHKKRRRLLPYIPSEDPARRLKQMGCLASALTALQMEFSDDLTYMPHMAPRSANQAKFESGGMQVLSKEDTETLEQCRAMCKRGECPPLIVVFDSCEGFTVEADGQIKDMTFIAEYTGDVDYLKNREHDDCDSMMTLILATDPSKSLLVCPDKRGNIARFINGINNHTLEGRKKQNCKCVRYSVNGECRVFLVATRDIAQGERLYYDYNGYEHEYPTHHFV